MIEQLREHGIDPAGKETEGDLLAEFYLSRPANEVAEVPIERLLAASTPCSALSAMGRLRTLGCGKEMTVLHRESGHRISFP